MAHLDYQSSVLSNCKCQLFPNIEISEIPVCDNQKQKVTDTNNDILRKTNYYNFIVLLM